MVEIVDKKNFTKAALDENGKIFMVYIAILLVLLIQPNRDV